MKDAKKQKLIPLLVPVPVLTMGFVGMMAPIPKKIAPKSTYEYLNGLMMLNLQLTTFFKGVRLTTVTIKVVSESDEFYEITKDNCNNIAFMSMGDASATGSRAKSVSVFYRISATAGNPKLIQDALALELIRGPYRVLSEREFKNVTLVEMEAIL